MRIHRSSSTPAALLAANDNGGLGAATSATPAPALPATVSAVPHSSPCAVTLAAANDNPGGATSASLVLTSLASVMARAYVAQILKDAQ